MTEDDLKRLAEWESSRAPRDDHAAETVADQVVVEDA
jgi:hypothetical protein